MLEQLLDLSFAFFFILTGFAIISSGAGLIYQARLSGGVANANWNVFIVVGSYIAMAIVSLSIYIKRKTATTKRLKGIPKSYIAIKEGDVPKSVSKLIESEFNRASTIVYVSRPTPRVLEGWGVPGSRYDGVNFRRGILDTLPVIDQDARTIVPSLPLYRPHLSAAQHFRPIASLITPHDPLCLDTYHRLIEKARYSQTEPSEADYERCLVLFAQLRQIFQFYQSSAASINGETEPSFWTASARTSFDTVGSGPI